MSTQGKVSLAIVVGGAFLGGILFATAGANLFGVGDAVGTSGQAAALDGSTQVEQSAPSTPSGFETAFSEVAASVNPAVVQIRAAKVVDRQRRNPFEGTPFERFFGQRGPSEPEVRQGLGSGVVVRSDGHIVTNNHVIQDAEQLSVQTLGGEQYEAEVVGTDQYKDLAVLKVDASDMTAISFGSSEQISVGQWVMAFGSPLTPQLNNSVTAGIISALGRLQASPQRGRGSNQGGGVQNFIQTDAAINPGNSGGPLVNLQGQLVGINTAIVSRSGGNQGIGFAVPSNTVERIATQIIEEGDVQRAYLGIRYRKAPETLLENESLPKGSAIVSQVEEGDPASEAGLEAGDIITGINGTPLENYLQLGNQIASMRPGEEASLQINRDGETRTLSVTLGARGESMTASGEGDQGGESPSSAEALQKELGLQLQDVTPDIARRLGLDEARGVVITGVDQSSRMIRDSGLQPRQVIFKMAGEQVSDMSAFMEAYQGVKPGDAFRIAVRNPDGFVFVTSLRRPTDAE
ncbi:trypsin-like peptidase domain-containing protein [Salinibacter altiplanensis]|uniref:trypsin-like peptidase domain-containing protein n=1 Tax=Salinibacter altiplanensis TaxID=1803181 RepID=UPI000C9F88EB|nr:trypsin-like peptidase domain-containing protein [Salinibacter altiplanensis]